MIKYPKSYIQYLSHFHGDRDYFECHEILEEYWKATDSGNKKSIWVGFILLAVSNYHYRRANFPGAKRTLEKALAILEYDGSNCRRLGINHEVLIETLKNRKTNILQKKPYCSINLPITDPELVKLCQEECKYNGFVWGTRSDLDNIEIVNRHSSRDRSDVLTDRKIALEGRQKERRQ
jgi:predicted metal-dependent hydrolase